MTAGGGRAEGRDRRAWWAWRHRRWLEARSVVPLRLLALAGGGPELWE